MIYILLFFFSYSYCFAQNASVLTTDEPSSTPDKKYPFINYDANYLQFKDSLALKQFFQALAGLENKQKHKVRIVHIGDSHIQADFFSGEVRRRLQQDKRFGNGGRGFIFPYTAAQTNNPFDYKTSYTGSWQGKSSLKKKLFSRWGLAGWTTVSNSFNSTISVKLLDDENAVSANETSQIRIFYPLRDKNSFHVNLLMESNDIINTYSHRSGFVEYHLKEPVTEFTLGLYKSDIAQNHFVLQGMSLENDQAGIIYSAVGVNGGKLDTYFRCEDFETQLELMEPDLVIVSLGTNDAYNYNFTKEAYKENYLNLIKKIRQATPQASLLLTTSGDNLRKKRYTNPNNAKIQEILRELVREQNVAIWDFYHVMGGLRSINKWYANKLARYDKIHLSQKGYAYQGKLLFEAINTSYLKWKEKYLGQ